MLQQLILPVSLNKFYDSYWTSRVLYLSNDSTKFKDLFSWARLNHLLENHKDYISTSQLKLSRHGKAIPSSEFLISRNRKSRRKLSVSKINTLCQEGASLIINSANLLDARIRKLSQELFDDIGEKNTINIYASHTDTPGFPTHFDTHEVLVLQIEGSKKWDIYENRPIQYPKSGHHDKFTNLKSEPTQYTMTKGDVLYVPRGVYHSAIAKDEPSLHLTIGIACRTHMDFLRWAIEELSEIAEFRRNLPLNHGAKAEGLYDMDQMKAISQDLSKGLEEILSDQELVKRYIAYCKSFEGGNETFQYPLEPIKE